MVAVVAAPNEKLGADALALLFAGVAAAPKLNEAVGEVVAVVDVVVVLPGSARPKENPPPGAGAEVAGGEEAAVAAGFGMVLLPNWKVEAAEVEDTADGKLDTVVVVDASVPEVVPGDVAASPKLKPLPVLAGGAVVDGTDVGEDRMPGFEGVKLNFEGEVASTVLGTLVSPPPPGLESVLSVALSVEARLPNCG